MTTVIFYITNNSFELAKRLKGLYPDTAIERFSPEAVKKIWEKSKNLIFIMATGIVVRTIAPLIKDKTTDPAVVVLDEKGKYAISLLSGHLGGANRLSREIAQFLGGHAVVTTSSDVNNLTAIDLWASEKGLAIENRSLLPALSTRYIDTGALNIYLDNLPGDLPLPKGAIEVGDPGDADLIITNKKDLPLEDLQGESKGFIKPLYLRPKNLIIGIGCNSNTSEGELEASIRRVLEENNLSFLSVRAIATIDLKGNEPGLVSLAERYGFRIYTYTSSELNSVVMKIGGIEKSDAVLKATGAYAVAEPAAIIASGYGRLLVPKQRIGNVTVAVAETKTTEQKDKKRETPREGGRLYVIGTGPGSIDYITPVAKKALISSEVIVGYGTYLDLIKGLIRDKEVLSTGMTQEIDRCRMAIEIARSGKTVSIVSGGDPGIYAMAGLIFEILRAEESKLQGESLNGSIEKSQKQFYLSPIHVEVIPGISALNACAAKLGAPLMHDFAVISLSDRLTPWELIEQRLEGVAGSDFVIVLYNPKSKGRPGHINKAREIILKHREPETPVGIVRGAMRENESIVITNIRDMLNHDIDMQTTIIIGNSQTYVWNNRMITPRGYEKKMQR